MFRQKANRRGIQVVLHSGSVRILKCDRERPTHALAKAAAMEEIYEALTHSPLPVIAKSPRASARIAQTLNLRGENPVSNL